MKTLNVTSCQAPNADFVCQAITKYLGQRLNVSTRFINELPWYERERLFDAGQIHISWLCGLPYTWKADRANSHLELLAAPVMAHPRYEGLPIYFSDVVVHRDSPFFTFADLRGATWAYNEPHSQSGYNLTRFHLATLGETSGYFGRVIEAGAHQAALEMIRQRRIDASAIDSSVLELELARSPVLSKEIRIVEALGPSPIPPWVILKSVSPEIRVAVQEAFLHMHQTPAGQSILAAGQMARFEAVTDTDYDPIRHMAQKAQAVRW